MANKRLPTFNRATREAIFQDADAEFVQVVDALPEYLQDMARFAYLTSWRRGDLLGLRRATASDADPALKGLVTLASLLRSAKGRERAYALGP
jgi:hypothetical protein